MFRYAYRAIYLVFAVVLASPLALAQVAVDPAPQAAAGNPIKFEVVSIRPYKVNISYGPGFTDDGFIVHGESPEAMLWGVCACKRIEGMPDWARFEVYEIEAKVADADVAQWKTLSVKQK